jgi:hypothetical protein
VGVDVILQDIEGKQISAVYDAPQNDLAHLVMDLDRSEFPLLYFVDPYGETIFNWRQVEALLDGEWQRFQKLAETDEARSLLREIEPLLVAASQGVDLYVKFFGD